jgi:hypothetical protein
MVAAMTLIMMVKIGLTALKTLKFQHENKQITEPALIKKTTPVKPVLMKSKPTSTQTKKISGNSLAPALTPELRGRATSYPRPGWLIKEVLMRQRTLYDCSYVSEASVIDLYKTYVDLINKENKIRASPHKLKKPTLRSFNTFIRFAEYLGLVKRTSYPVYDGSMRKRYTLTQTGIADNTSWNDLCGTWKKIRDKVVFKMPSSIH